MLQLFGAGVITLWLKSVGIDPPKPQPVDQVATNFQPLNYPAPATEQALDQYLAQLASQGFTASNQGIWIQSQDQLLASHQGTTPLSAASLTKVATSLVALQTWGPDYRFVTQISATGPIQNGVLQGDLVVQGGGDPLFVWEEAISLGNTLNQLGINQVAGDLVIQGDFAMNYELNPLLVGNLLQQGLNADDWSAEAQAQFAQMSQGTPRPQIKITGAVRSATLLPTRLTPLVRHRSLSLVQLLRQMNIYSNNAMAEMLAVQLGGAATVAQQAAIAANVPPEEIQLVNGSGLSPENRLSPRAVAGLFQGIQSLLQSHNLPIADVFPVAGENRGTLESRDLPAGTVAKTGTLWNVSTLAGMIPTQKYGPTWFAILNQGAGVEDFRQQQDKLLQTLQQQLGEPTETAIQPSSPPERLGQVERNQILITAAQNR